MDVKPPQNFVRNLRYRLVTSEGGALLCTRPAYLKFKIMFENF